MLPGCHSHARLPTPRPLIHKKGEQGRGPYDRSLARLRGDRSDTAPITGSDLWVDGPLLALGHDLVHDALEAGTGLTVVVREGKMTDLAIAKYPGATFRIHGLCHLHNVAR